jgi:hypothetical protein
MTAVDTYTQSGFSFEIIYGHVSQAISGQRKILAEMKGIAERIQLNSAKAYNALNSVPAPTLDSIPGEAQMLQLVTEAPKQLTDAFKTLGPLFAGKMALVENFMNPSADLVMNKVNLVLIKQGSSALSQVKEAVAEALLAEKYVYPLVSDALQKSQAFDQAWLAGAPFAIETQGKALIQACASARSQIATTHLSDGLKRKMENTLAGSCDPARDNLDQMYTHGMTKSAYLTSYARSMARAFTPRCIRGDAQLNCQVLRMLLRITDAQISKMDDGELSAFEQAWVSVSKTQGAGGANS